MTTPNDTGAAVWQMAIDFHSFSMVALNHRFLLGLPVDDAIEIAAASLKLAAASIETPGVVRVACNAHRQCALARAGQVPCKGVPPPNRDQERRRNYPTIWEYVVQS